MNKYTESDAWDAMDNYRPEHALKIWNSLILESENKDEIDNFKSNSCYALLGLNRIDEAREIYIELFNKHKNHQYAHQLCMVEREAKNYKKALKYLEIEKGLISQNDILAKSANLYEYGKINELMGEFSIAMDYAQKCIKESLKCDDLIMLACANRLLGDIYSHSDIDEAAVCYIQAQKYFTNAGDDFGAKEVEELIEGLDNE